MPKRLVIAVDAMGGDYAPAAVIEGVKRAYDRNPDVFFLLFGDQDQILEHVKRVGLSEDAFKIYHTSQVVKATDKPSAAVRYGRESSMWKAIYAVRSGEASAVVSGGNTGALMAMSKIVLGTLAGVDRPAIAAIMPTVNYKQAVVMLDLGANAECNAGNLVEFAMMGAVFYRLLFGVREPRVGLLNIGSEETKGREEIREAAMILRNNKINYQGFIEGFDICAGGVDVVVSDGFSGNVALKTLEGTVHLLKGTIKNALKRSLLARICSIFTLPIVWKVKEHLDPRSYNGGLFLGLNGVSVKSHGGSDGIGHYHALQTAINLARQDLCEKIRTRLEDVILSTDMEE
ncbi:MAG: phosphate acyltransferase PlsX [Alphaproteobacteria bacterium]|nr:phosphate acyltransferase PlsX [Alphaproteobacteria bacterium]